MKTQVTPHRSPNHYYRKPIILFLTIVLVFASSFQSEAQNIIPGPNTLEVNNSVGNDVIVYDAYYFGGTKKAITKDEVTLGNLRKKVSSITVPLGKKVTIYEGPSYGGKTLVLYPGNYPGTHYWNDRATGIKVENIPLDEPVAYFFEHVGKTYENQYFQGMGAGSFNADLICHDCFSELWITGELEVIAYQDPDFRGVSNEGSPLGKGRYNLEDYGLNENISSIKISNLTWTLLKTVLKNSKLIEKRDQKTFGYNVTGTNTNVPGSPLMKATASGCFEASATQSFESTITAGITNIIRTNVTAGVEGVLQVSIEHELALSLETAFTNGQSNTVTTSQCWSIERELPVPQGCEGKVTLLATPEVRDWTIEKHYVQVDNNGKIVPGGEIRIIPGTLRVTKGIGATTNISLDENCNNSTTNNNLNTNSISTTTNNTNTSNTQTVNNTPKDSKKWLVEFSDNSGAVAGYFYGKEGKWEEQDIYRNPKFYFSEDWENKDESKIILHDMDRQNLIITLDFKNKDVLIIPGAEEEEFKLYNITNVTKI